MGSRSCRCNGVGPQWCIGKSPHMLNYNIAFMMLKICSLASVSIYSVTACWLREHLEPPEIPSMLLQCFIWRLQPSVLHPSLLDSLLLIHVNLRIEYLDSWGREFSLVSPIATLMTQECIYYSGGPLRLPPLHSTPWRRKKMYSVLIFNLENMLHLNTFENAHLECTPRHPSFTDVLIRHCCTSTCFVLNLSLHCQWMNRVTGNT